MHTSVICVRACVCACARAHVCHGALGEMGENSIEECIHCTGLILHHKHSTNWARYHPSAVMKE